MSEGGQVTSPRLMWKSNARKYWHFLRKRWYILVGYLVLGVYWLVVFLYMESGGFVFSYTFQSLQIYWLLALIVWQSISLVLILKDERKS
jgi:hypothetical protein